MKKKTRKIKVFFFCLILLYTIPFTAKATVLYPYLEAKTDLLMDADTGVIYIADDKVDEPYAIASLTKLMSIYVVFDEMKEQNVSQEDIVPISSRVVGIKNENPLISGVYYQSGQQMTVGELIDLSLIYSDNGAIIALSEYLSGSEKAHVDKMNAKAQELGMTQTNFVNVSGLTTVDYGDYKIEGYSDDDDNVSTARNLGLMCYNLIKDYPQILDITSETSLEYNGLTYYTSNYLLEGMPNEYAGAKGLKTGTTPEAGNCFIGYLETDDRNYISVVLGAPDTASNNRFLETIEMYDWAKEQRYSTLISDEKPFTSVDINGASQKNIPLYANKVDVLTSDTTYLELSSVELNKAYFDEDNYLIKEIPKNGRVATLTFTTPKDSINLQTIFSEDNTLKVDLITKEKIEQENSVSKIFTSFKIFVNDVYEAI